MIKVQKVIDSKIDAELVLVECKPEESLFAISTLGSGIWLTQGRGRIRTPATYHKPILISKLEEIEVGDWYYCKEEEVVLQADYEPKGEDIYKVLALPEHFSPKHLQDIVDGKLKEGKVVVECEESICICGEKENHHINHDESLLHRPIEEVLCNECGKFFLPYQIKLNPHITLYEVEEKMYTLQQFIDHLKRFSDGAPISWIINNLESEGLK